MALTQARDNVPDAIIAPGGKNFLESFPLGRFALRTGRSVRRMLRKLRDPAERKAWISRMSLPLRNAMVFNRPLTVPLGGVPVLLEPRGTAAAAVWSGLRGKQQEVEFLLSVLDSGMILFDVGADAGMFAISAAGKVGAKNVFAFEGDRQAGDLLKRNLLLNGLAGVHVLEQALADPSGGSGPNLRAGQAGITTVDVFIKEHDVQHVDVMKVDSEGAELLVLHGARNLLQRADAPVVVYEESGRLCKAFGYHPVEILWFLESYGYSFFKRNNHTGEISELNPDFGYDSMVIAVKQTHSGFEKFRARVK